MQSFELHTRRGYHLSIESIRKGNRPFLSKRYKGKELDLRAELPHIKLWWVPPLEHHPKSNPTQQNLWKSRKFSTATTSMNFSHLFGRVACSRLQISWKNRSKKVAWGSGACERCFQQLIHVHVHTGIPYDWYVLTVNINTYVNLLALHARSQKLCQTCESYTAHFGINILTQELVFLEVDEVMGGLRY